MNAISKTIFAGVICSLFGLSAHAQGFSANAIQWNIPNLGETDDEQVYGDLTHYTVLDFDGDSRLDLIDSQDNTTSQVWMAGSQRYWKVYLNTGTGFSASAIQWNIPDLGETDDEQVSGDLSHYVVLDFDGDGRPDLIDSQDNATSNVWIAGSQKYWKVYLNTGTGFSATAIQWNIHDLGETDDEQVYGDLTHYTVLDFNGDARPDLIDSQDNATSNVWIAGSQKYWKVYLNTGTGFSASATQWNIPDLGETDDEQVYGDLTHYTVLDFDGDARPDLIDSQDNVTSNVWMAGSQKYWKVFLNTGTGFSASATQWNIPDLGETDDEQVYGDLTHYTVLDFNGDARPDLIDSQDNVTSQVWMAGGQRYWKVFLNTGTGFSASATQWNIPDLGETDDEQVYGDLSHYTVLDFNGDATTDLIDSQDNATSQVWMAGSQRYWKVYLNTTPTVGTPELLGTSPEVLVFPNPFINTFALQIRNANSSSHRLMLMDVHGKIVFQEVLYSEQAVFDLDLPSGVYFYQVINESQETIGSGKVMRQ